MRASRALSYDPCMDIDHRLATYGTLAPGRANHHQLAGLTGHWRPGTVTGRLVATGWAADLGYPALLPMADGEPIAVQLFESTDLPAHWDRLDAFEGADYRRTRIDVRLGDISVPAWIYVAAATPA